MNKCTNYQFYDIAINPFPALKPSGVTALYRLLDLEFKSSSSPSLAPQHWLQAVPPNLPLHPFHKGFWIYCVGVQTQPKDRPFLLCPFMSLFFLSERTRALFAFLLNTVPAGQISLICGPYQTLWGLSLLSVLMLMGCHRWLKLTYSRCFVYSANKKAAWN